MVVEQIDDPTWPALRECDLGHSSKTPERAKRFRSSSS